MIGEFQTRDGKTISVTADFGPPSDEEAWEPTYTVTNDGVVTQVSLSADEIVRYLCNAAHNANHVAGAVIYQIEGFCPPAPDNTALDREDGGAALIFHTNAYESAEAFAAKELREEPEHGMFVRIHSYDERIWEKNGALPEAHDEIAHLFGKRVRVTVEVLDD